MANIQQWFLRCMAGFKLRPVWPHHSMTLGRARFKEGDKKQRWSKSDVGAVAFSFTLGEGWLSVI